jgi:uncharacterized phage protein (TIGR01671 family)
VGKMRKIKFRYWDGENMIDGDSLAFEEYAPITHLLTREGTMQYTGSEDSKSVEIYEGDILGHSNGEKGFYEVVWKDSAFQRKYTFIRKYQGESWKETSYMPMHARSFKVVGNIHENAELLVV